MATAAGVHRRTPRWVRPATGVVIGAGLLCVLAVVRTAGSPACAAGVAAAARAAVVAAALSGQATHYVGDGGGNCSFDSGSTDLFVALGPAEYSAGAACGSYLDVTGPKGSVRVKVTDQCPECGTGHLDLSRTAFAAIGTLSDGIIPITYRIVRDPQLRGPLTIRVKEGSSAYWLAVRADNHGNRLSTVELKTSSGGWLPLWHTDYNHWIDEDGAGVGPFTLRLTDVAGHRAIVNRIALAPGRVQATNVFMYGARAPALATATKAAGRPSGAPSKSPSDAPPSTPAAPPVSPSTATSSPVAGHAAGRAAGRSCRS